MTYHDPPVDRYRPTIDSDPQDTAFTIGTMPNRHTVDALRRIERLSRALRYRLAGDCIEPSATTRLTDRELAASLLTDITIVVENTMTPAEAIG